MDPIQIPADLTAPYAVPADVTPEQLVELRAAAREQAIALLDAEDATDETVAQAEWLASAIDVIATAETAIVSAADLAKRLGLPDPMGVTDAQIVDWFKIRGAAPQFVYDWQDAFATGGTGFGATAAATTWPTSMKFLVYPAGTWARALEPVISLDAVYDSALLLKNKYTALFQEQGRATIKRGLTSRVVTVDVFPNGFTGPIALAASAAL